MSSGRIFKLALVGRSNVGKSSVFNRLTGLKTAVVFDQPGSTRDGQSARCEFGNHSVLIRDTPGVEDGSELHARMKAVASNAVSESDAVCFIWDAQIGLTPWDIQLAAWVRQLNPPIVFPVANKAESQKDQHQAISDGYELGWGEPLLVSAKFDSGIDELKDRVLEVIGESSDGAEATDTAVESDEEQVREQITIAICGRPNTGKSSLVNALFKQEKVLTDSKAGTTTDAMEFDWSFKKQSIRLIDTAGVNKTWRVHQKIEMKEPAMQTLRALRKSDIVVIAVDATEVLHGGGGLNKHEISIAREATDFGKCVAIAVNKWDAIPSDKQGSLRKAILEKIQIGFPQIKGLPVVFISAQTGANLNELMRKCVTLYQTWSIKISTSDLNEWLRAFILHFPPPWKDHKKCNIKYLVQTNTKPPTFILWTNLTADFPDNYLQQFRNSLREEFNIIGPPIMFLLRTTYVPKSIVKAKSRRKPTSDTSVNESVVE